jgi:hypothetical protein
MLLFLLCAYANLRPFAGAAAFSSPFNDPSAVLLKPWVAGESRGMGLYAVSPVCSAFAAAGSILGAFTRASDPRAWAGDLGIGASMGSLWPAATLVEVGEVRSVSVVVDVDRLLDDEGSFGAQKVLDTVE